MIQKKCPAARGSRTGRGLSSSASLGDSLTNTPPHEKTQGAVTAERLRELLHYDPETGTFTRLVAAGRVRVGDAAGSADNGYRGIRIGHRRYRAHRLAFLYMTGDWPPYQVDHINLDKADNRWVNLRLATSSQNRCNTRPRKDNKSGRKGVHKRRSTWVAVIKINRRSVHLGSFDDFEKAADARIAGARILHGAFARWEP